MIKNDQLQLTAIDYTEKGIAVCKHEGFVVFVPNLLIHETALIHILKVNAKHAYGKVVQLIETSPDRVQPKCPIYAQCGGCQLQHMSAAHQLQFKEKHVKSLFERTLAYTGPFESIVGMEEPWNYRNKALVPYNPHDNSYGFYKAHTHDIVPFSECIIQSDDANDLLKAIQAFYLSKDIQPMMIRTILIKKGFSTQDLMCVLVVNDLNVPLIYELSEVLQEKFKTLMSLQLNLNTREDNVVLGEEYQVIFGSSVIEDTLDDLRFEISAPSFYQVNSLQTVKLYQKAIEYANLSGNETVLDLYCGIGTIGLLASRNAKKVIGVEVVASAIENAKRNASINSIKNVEWICADAAQALEVFIENKQKIDVVIVDPPRKGLDSLSLQTLLTMNPKRLVYVSCDPGTLVRDVALLQEKYTLEKVSCVDMFSQTYHVETVCLLERISN